MHLALRFQSGGCFFLMLIIVFKNMFQLNFPPKPLCFHYQFCFILKNLIQFYVLVFAAAFVVANKIVTQFVYKSFIFFYSSLIVAFFYFVAKILSQHLVYIHVFQLLHQQSFSLQKAKAIHLTVCSFVRSFGINKSFNVFQLKSVFHRCRRNPFRKMIFFSLLIHVTHTSHWTRLILCIVRSWFVAFDSKTISS